MAESKRGAPVIIGGSSADGAAPASLPGKLRDAALTAGASVAEAKPRQTGSVTDAGSDTLQGDGSPAGTEPVVGEAGYSSFWQAMRVRWESFYSQNRHAVFYAILGFVIAFALLVIGFWRTMLLCIFITAGIAYGQYRDGNPRIILFFLKLIGRDE